MELYGRVLLVAMPLFLILIIIEKVCGVLLEKDTYNSMDTISSLSSGITNSVKDVLGLSISLITYDYLVKHLAIFEIKSSILVYIIAFIALDFQGYWVHRIAHEINFFWNQHVVHHSSEEYNLACALRQSVSSFFKIFTFFLLPAAILGVPSEVIAIVAPLHLFAQFWYHTRLIGKMGFLEKIIVTPSHHRVHHAINEEYLDKNHSQIFIIWDKLFGTFQEELPDVAPVYGITRPASTWNPIKINFQHIWLLFKDAVLTKNWKDKILIWFKPTGWRPDDVAQNYPLHKINDIFHFPKYNPDLPFAMKLWAWVQLAVILGFVSYLFGNIVSIGTPNMFYYGAFVFAAIYSLTELMDRNPFAIVYELLKNAICIYYITSTQDWFGISKYSDHLPTMILGYFIISSIVTVGFVLAEFQQEISERKWSF